MRFSRLMLATLVAVVGHASVANAAPTLSLTWIATTGSGTTGGSSIDAVVGDTLEVLVTVDIDAAGFTGAAWDLVGSHGLTAAANTLVTGAGGPPECPSPPNLAPGTCFSSTFKAYSPIAVGVTDIGSRTDDYDVAGTTPEFVPGQIVLGRGVFTVGPTATTVETVRTSFAPGAGGVTDGAFVFSVPAVDVATINVLNGSGAGSPEASTTYLVGSTNRTPDTGNDDQPTLLSIGQLGETSLPLYLVKPAEVQIAFVAECTVAAPDERTWLNVDLLVDGIAITPTNADDAFCTSTGTNALNRWVSASRDASVSLSPGMHQIEVRAHIPLVVFDPGESWRLDDKALVLTVKTEDL